MPEALKYLIDAAVGFGLFMALMIVFLADWAFFNKGVEPIKNDLDNVTVIGGNKTQGDPQRLRLAVTPTAFSQVGPKKELWDDMGKLLKELGDGYRYDEITEEDILSKHKMLANYDVLFLTCAGGGDALENDLRAFVTGGGILYASDWRYDAVAKAFPEMAVPNLRGDGDKQEVNADVVDPALRDRLRSAQMKLKFDLAEWKPAAFGGPRVKVLLQGTYRRLANQGGGTATAPLMVKFSVGKGTVIFTSFHNEKQNSRTEKELLQYLVFSLVTAGIDAEISGEMEKGGFTPAGSNLLSSPATDQSTPPKTYENKNVTTLRFALGFRSDGARLRFNIKSPDGKHYTWEGESTVVLEVANAQAGPWTYTVTARRVPYANFPFTVTVGEKK